MNVMFWEVTSRLARDAPWHVARFLHEREARSYYEQAQGFWLEVFLTKVLVIEEAHNNLIPESQVALERRDRP